MTELLTLEQLRALPNDVMAVNDPVIYFLWQDDELIYVGATEESDVRIARHIRDRNTRRRPMMFNRYTFLEPPDRSQLWRLEEEYHRHYKPQFNSPFPARKVALKPV